MKLDLSDGHYSSSVSRDRDDFSGVFRIESLPRFLSQSVYIIDSANSGTGRSSGPDVWNDILQPAFNFLGVTFHYLRTTSRTSVAEFAHNFAESDATIVFISGDTSITEFVNALPSLEISNRLTIFPIPAGTGNSLALSLGHLDIASSIEILLTSRNNPTPLNLYSAKFPGHSSIVNGKDIQSMGSQMIFLVVFSWAFHASLVADSDSPEMRKKGIERFKLAAQTNLLKEQRYLGKTSVGEGEIVEGPYAYWLVTLAQRFEPSFLILPCGSISDDNLYLVAFKSEPSDDGQYIMDVMNQVYDRGSHIKNPKVTYRRVPRGQTVLLQVDPASHNRFCLDGTIIHNHAGEQDSTITVSAIGNSFRSWLFYVIV